MNDLCVFFYWIVTNIFYKVLVVNNMLDSVALDPIVVESMF